MQNLMMSHIGHRLLSYNMYFLKALKHLKVDQHAKKYTDTGHIMIFYNILPQNKFLISIQENQEESRIKKTFSLWTRGLTLPDELLN